MKHPGGRQYLFLNRNEQNLKKYFCILNLTAHRPWQKFLIFGCALQIKIIFSKIKIYSVDPYLIDGLFLLFFFFVFVFHSVTQTDKNRIKKHWIRKEQKIINIKNDDTFINSKETEYIKKKNKVIIRNHFEYHFNNNNSNNVMVTLFVVVVVHFYSRRQ